MMGSLFFPKVHIYWDSALGINIFRNTTTPNGSSSLVTTYIASICWRTTHPPTGCGKSDLSSTQFGPWTRRRYVHQRRNGAFQKLPEHQTVCTWQAKFVRCDDSGRLRVKRASLRVHHISSWGHRN